MAPLVLELDLQLCQMECAWEVDLSLEFHACYKKIIPGLIQVRRLLQLQKYKRML